MRGGVSNSLRLLLAPALVLAAFHLSAEEPPEAKLPASLRQLVEAAQSAPPAFAADGLMQVIESGKIQDRDVSRALLDRAFHLASSAGLKFAMRARLRNLADTEAGAMDEAYRLNLDSLSLQSRAVRDLIALDHAKARALFLEIPKPVLPDSIACGDPLVPDVSPLYSALTAVVQNSFTEQERRKEDHIGLMLDYFSGITTIEQVQAAGRMIADVNVTPRQREMLTSRLESLHAAIQAKAPDCGVASSKEVTTLTAPDPAKAQPFWQSNSAKNILAAAKALRFGSGGLRSGAERQSPEWLQQLTDFRSQLGDWRRDDSESEAIFYHEKSLGYEVLVELTVPGDERYKILNEYISFAEDFNLQQYKPVEWYSG
ncbi:MAG: hypothetical protein ACRD4P_07150, partial [Bryobacteraceae bacterium]